jgi:hypothetical protein
MNDVAMEPLPIHVPPQCHVWRYLSLSRLFTTIETKRLSLTLLKKYTTDDPDVGTCEH